MVREYQEFLISIQQNPDMLSDSLALEQNHFFVSIRYLYSTNAWGADGARAVSWEKSSLGRDRAGVPDHDLGAQLLQLVLQLGYKVVAGNEELELLAFQLAVFALCDHVDTVICDAKPLVTGCTGAKSKASKSSYPACSSTDSWLGSLWTEDVHAYLFRAAAILAWKRTLTSTVAAGPINTSALNVGPDPEIMLGLATALASARSPCKEAEPACRMGGPMKVCGGLLKGGCRLK
ncbi:MAG: hypothetical protein FRX49_04307 [Trebouxia sp. A1-2]|nr:MAG: hypothetical protein FRX49_04307 [Trebouxia sp. A1-2]